MKIEEYIVAAVFGFFGGFIMSVLIPILGRHRRK